MVLDSHTTFRDNIPAYAMGALDVEEVSALEAHLKTCDSCQTELAEYRAVSDSLLMVIPPKQPSAALRRKLQSRLPSMQKSTRPRFAWPMSRLASATAFAFLLVMNLYSILQTRALQLEQAQLVHQFRTGQTVLSMLSYPTTERLPIKSENVVGSLLLDKDRDIVALIVWNMPPLTEKETYQIWLIDPQGDRVSAGLFRPESDQAYTTQIVFPKQSLSDFTGIGVTVEPAGGSDAPTGERVFKVDF
jgi:anti-sigma-K factor RskA